MAIDILYTGQLHCEATHGLSGATILTDAPPDSHGKGEAFSPTDLVATALGTCVLTVMGIAAERLGVDLVGARARVEKVMVAAPSRRIGALSVHVEVPNRFAEDICAKLEAAALTCPVKPSLHPDIRVDIAFSWA